MTNILTIVLIGYGPPGGPGHTEHLGWVNLMSTMAVVVGVLIGANRKYTGLGMCGTTVFCVRSI